MSNYEIFKDKQWKIKRKKDGVVLSGSFTSERSAERYIKNILRDDMFVEVVTYQYGTSEPSTNEEQAFINWCKDNFEVNRLVERKWGIDTEYTHGIEGLLSIGTGKRKRIGPDLEIKGTIKDLLDSILEGEEVYQYLEINGYCTTITYIELSAEELDDIEIEWLKVFCVKHGIETNWSVER